MKFKRFFAWILIAAMLATGSTAACAAGLQRAAECMDIAEFERYPSFTWDESTGKWSVRTNQADGLMDRFWTYGKANSTALCAFAVELEGNAQTGIWTPVMRFYYMDGLEINATAVSILVGEERFDLAAASEEIANERYTAEMISAPLNEQAMDLLNALLNTDNASVRLIGERIYTAELDLDTTNSRRRIEAASLNGIESAVALLNEAGIDSYGLWDLSAAAWEAEYGFAPAFARSTVVRTIGETEVTDDFGMVVRNSQARAAKTAQEILIEYGFMSGTATGTFGENSMSAARRAQHYLGMIETGCMDAQLEKALAAGPEDQASSEKNLIGIGECVSIALDRYWFATGIAPANTSEGFYTVNNRDNVFLAADGWIRNISSEEIRLFTQVEASIVYNDTYSFEANVVCERDAGTSLDAAMLPMAQARMIVYGEVPAWLQTEAEGTWRIELAANTESIEYELQ